jgi:hypothetical protein
MAKIRQGLTVLGAAVALSLLATTATASGRQAINTAADYTPGRSFEPLAASAACAPATDAPLELPAGYDQEVVAEEGEGGTTDLWDMHTQNEFGKDAGRYVYRTHETSPDPVEGIPPSAVSVTDLQTGQTQVLAQRADWERFDGIVWTPWGTILAAEEVITAAVRDPAVPEATAGLVYEFFIDPTNPGQLKTDDPRDDVAPFDDGVAVRPALGSKSHEGLRFDRRGNHYGISESNPGAIYRFVPDRKGDLSEGTLLALKTANGHDGEGTWVDVPDELARTDAQAAAAALGANGYNRPEDVETGQSTGVDRNSGGNTLYVAITGTDEVLAIDLSRSRRPFAYDYVFTADHPASGSGAANAPAGEFDSPDNLALDRKGNLAITEDPSTNTVGADIWIAAPPSRGRHQPASTVARFASLMDCEAEPTGIYFALKGTERYTSRVIGESLLVNRQHAELGTTNDQLISITPTNGS